jgi:hypothetical protein
MRKVIPRRLKPNKFRKKWLELQKLCARPETWPLAVTRADKLLDEALKKKRCKGKSMGERLVSAQHLLSDNDSVWYSHNLAKKVVAETSLKLRQTQVRKSLVGFGRALKDLGALNEQQTNE